MNWATWLPALIALGGSLFTAGLLSGKVSDHDKKIDRHDSMIEGHAGLLATHTTDIAVMKAWREGYNAGVGHQGEAS